MTSKRSAAVARRFGARADTYDDNADLQRHVAEQLARLLPPLDRPCVLELGCGTGLFSRELIKRYPQGSFVLTDLSPAMLDQCRVNLRSGPGKAIKFELHDANIPDLDRRFDLIALSMTLHWLADPLAALARLRASLNDGGALVYATIGSDSFPEWRAALASEHLQSGLIDIPELPGIVTEEHLVIDADTLSFLRRMQSIGGLTPKEGYTPLPAGALRRAIRRSDEMHGGRITWHIVYGALPSLDASQSSPSTRPA
jgi:malonyl-CoA O-methyltransferase